jgi:hypothetical protein
VIKLIIVISRNFDIVDHTISFALFKRAFIFTKKIELSIFAEAQHNQVLKEKLDDEFIFRMCSFNFA